MTRREALKLAALALASACVGSKPDAIAYDTDACAFCRMTISDPRFAASIMLVKGRTLKFDSIDCLIAYYDQANAAHQIASVWVDDFRRPGTLIDARSARYVDLGGGRAPMGGRRGIAAVSSDADAASLGVNRTRSWAELL